MLQEKFTEDSPLKKEADWCINVKLNKGFWEDTI